MPLLEPALLTHGYLMDRIDLPDELQTLVIDERWMEVDQMLGRLLEPGGPLFTRLQRYHTFRSIEYILSIRDSADPDQEDGIWHDDGSRQLAATLSLTPDAAGLEGGRLGIRRKGDTGGALVPTPPFGHLIVYLTGHYGIEHRIHQVTRGRRIVAAIWCSA